MSHTAPGNEGAADTGKSLRGDQRLLLGEHPPSAVSARRRLSDERLMAIAVIALVILVIAPIALYFALIAPEEEPEIPSAVMSMSEIAHGFRFTIADVNGTILWANARISLFSSLVGTAVGWQSPSSSIPMISGVVWYGETIQFGGTNATLELTDAAGDGTIDVGDYFTVVAEPSGFAHGITYYLEIRAPSYVSSLDFVA